MEALEYGNGIRTFRKELKERLKLGQTSIIEVLLDPVDHRLETMKLLELLLAVPTFGKVKAEKTLFLCRISPSKTIGGMSQRQRSELISMLRR